MKALSTCPAVEELEHFSTGQLLDAEAEHLEQHLAQCGDCLATMHTLHSQDTLVEAVRAQGSGLVRRSQPEVVDSLIEQLKGLRAAPDSQDPQADREWYSFLAVPETAGPLGRFGPYQVLRVLGIGGMGVVFEAQDAQLRRSVALKALRPRLAGDPAARKRFLREAQATAAIEHDHIVPVYQVGEDQGVPFLAMPLLQGETLEARLRREGPLPLPEILRIGRAIAEGLVAAHAHGLIHRDIKPANIWLESRETEPESRVKLLDFGLARAMGDEESLTGIGFIAGTPAYMAPEQAGGVPVDGRSDLFSLGSVLYVLCTGQPPFQAGSSLAVLRRVSEAAPRPIPEINPAAPHELVQLIAKLHAKDPKQRFQSAGEVVEALGRCQMCSAPPKPSTRRGPGKIGSWKHWLVAAGVLLVVGIGLGATSGVGRLLQGTGLAPDNPEQTTAAAEAGTESADTAPVAGAEDETASRVYPMALFTFEERGSGAKDYGAKVTDILFARLAARPELYLVDRNDLKKLLAEQELNLSGAVAAREATKVGQLTGAKLLVTGSVIHVDKKLYVVAKVIGTETSRVVGASVDGHVTDELGPLVDKLAEAVADVVAKQADKLVAQPVRHRDRVAEINQKLKKGTRPVVLVRITERHVGRPALDPAAQTEFMLLCKETGFTVLDPEEAARGKADVVITGEGMSEFAARHSNLVSVRARVEVKAVDRRTDKVLAVDRQTTVVVDLTEQLAGKAALQEAAALLAERILPRLVKE